MNDGADSHAAKVYKHGFRWEGDDPVVLRTALDAAFDYRGDVTLILDGSEVTGYLFNRDFADSPPFVQILPADGAPRRRIALDSIRGVAFSGRDTAEGKSWQTWLNAHKAKKEADARGERAGSIDRFPDSLE